MSLSSHRTIQGKFNHDVSTGRSTALRQLTLARTWGWRGLHGSATPVAGQRVGTPGKVKSPLQDRLFHPSLLRTQLSLGLASLQLAGRNTCQSFHFCWAPTYQPYVRQRCPPPVPQPAPYPATLESFTVFTQSQFCRCPGEICQPHNGQVLLVHLLGCNLSLRLGRRKQIQQGKHHRGEEHGQLKVASLHMCSLKSGKGWLAGASLRDQGSFKARAAINIFGDTLLHHRAWSPAATRSLSRCYHWYGSTRTPSTKEQHHTRTHISLPRQELSCRKARLDCHRKAEIVSAQGDIPGRVASLVMLGILSN